MEKTNFPVAIGTKPVNSGTQVNGKLDEKLSQYRTQVISQDPPEGIIIFQFETGGFSVSFKRGMSMSHVADKLEGAARRLRMYQERGWPA